MSYEIEMKARIKETDVDRIRSFLNKCSYVKSLGTIEKDDIYWALHDSDKTLFRTRHEISQKGNVVCFTAKPIQEMQNNIETNEEHEFEIEGSKWNEIIDFCNCLNLEICRHKYKSGFHFLINTGDFNIHCEILNVKYLGWFIESEIIIENNSESLISKAKNCLTSHFKELSIEESDIEFRSYRQLLQEVGHLKG